MKLRKRISHKKTFIIHTYEGELYLGLFTKKSMVKSNIVEKFSLYEKTPG